MKKILLLSPLLSFFLILSCSPGKIEPQSFTSPFNESYTIKVNGKREVALDPIEVTITFSNGSIERKSYVEFQSQSLTAENCSATWEKNGACKLVFQLADGDKVVADAKFSPENIKAVIYQEKSSE